MLSLLLGIASLPQVTLRDLGEDAFNLSTLTQYPNPPYTTRQASSYDRTSLAPGNDAWFANKDWGNYVRVDETTGRKEWVLTDVQGPGAIVRIWTPNPTGTMRIYIDGQTQPTIEERTVDLLSGKVRDYPMPLAQETSKGWTLYCPIPYQKSVKVTVDNTEGNAEKMYYQVQYRTYASDVTVEKFSPYSALKLAGRMAASTVGTPVQSMTSVPMDLEPGTTATKAFADGGQVSAIVVNLPKPPSTEEWTDPNQWHNALRSIRVRAWFDGESCIDAPLGDLMGSQAGVLALDTMPAKASADGTMSLHLPMPFKRDARFEFTNTSKVSQTFTVGFVHSPYKWSSDSMYLKAQWLSFKGRTRPMVDLSFLNASGEGVFIGCNVAISNPTADWWGEGDEKITQDGETFPSTFGTGTEDYFGYGWCSPILFHHPFHYQSRCDGPGNKGHSSIGRWQILDRMPYTRSLKFDMELWHWADVNMLYSRTAYWYSKPGGSAPVSDDPSLFPLPFIESGIKRVKGAIEGEEMKVLTSTGGDLEVQDFANLSNGKQLWWRDADPRHELRLAVPVAKSGRYRVFGRFCAAADYGVHDISFGTISRQIDFFGKLSWKTIDLGVTYLEKSTAAPFKVWVHGANPKAEKRHMFGLDYLLLVPES